MTAMRIFVAFSAHRWPPTHQIHASNTYQRVPGPRALATSVGHSFAGRRAFMPRNGTAEHACVWRNSNYATVQPPAAFIPMLRWAACMLLWTYSANIWTDAMRSPYATRIPRTTFYGVPTASCVSVHVYL